MAQTRETPTGTKLDDGFSTKIALEGDTNIDFWEKTVQPPGIDGGDSIDITNMWNSALRTKAARSLYDLTDVSLTVAYDPLVYDQIIAIINSNGQVTVTFPDTSTLTFYGYLKSFEPSELSEGEEPTADITIVCTNVNPNTDAETAPVFSNNSGT